MPRVNFASSCRSVPSQVPELVETPNWRLEVKEAQPWGLMGRKRKSNTNVTSGVQIKIYTLLTDPS